MATDDQRGGVGDWLYNPVTGELGTLTVSPYDNGGQVLESELWLQPGAAVVGEHVHPALLETFDVLAGMLAYKLDGVDGSARAGEQVRIEPGVVHDWWNRGEAPAHVRVRVESTDPSRPLASRFVGMIEVIWSLAAAGKTNSRGVPGPLWLAAFADEYRDVIVMAKPPVAVQRAIFGPLAAIARRRGRNPLDPAMHGRACPAWIPAPDDETRARLLAVRAPAKDARAS